MERLPHPVYPGHPLVLALYAMREYPSAREALAPTEHGWPELVGNSAIPGAGDGAYAAASLLRAIWENRVPIQTAHAVAHGQWTRMVGPGTGNHEKAYEPGVEQAKELRELFEETARNWDWNFPD